MHKQTRLLSKLSQRQIVQITSSATVLFVVKFVVQKFWQFVCIILTKHFARNIIDEEKSLMEDIK